MYCKLSKLPAALQPAFFGSQKFSCFPCLPFIHHEGALFAFWAHKQGYSIVKRHESPMLQVCHWEEHSSCKWCHLPDYAECPYKAVSAWHLDQSEMIQPTNTHSAKLRWTWVQETRGACMHIKYFSHLKSAFPARSNQLFALSWCT